jgi:hypothetical protein
METSKNKWEGLRAIIVGRQSDDAKGTASTEAQLDHIEKVLAGLGMRVVDTVSLEGVSAASPARIAEIVQKLFKRKKDDDDFDVIVWQIEDRATRGGGKFGMWLEHEAERNALRVFFTDSQMEDQPYAPVVRVAKYEAAKEESVSKGRRSTQGHDLAKKKGFFRTAGQTPLGCDRLYYGDNDKPKFIIRNFGNGLQEQVDYKTKVVIGRFGTIGKKSRNRFIKQRNEYSLLIPGERRERRIVRVIFYLRYKKGWRGCRIADYLNRLKVPAPKGGEWSPRQVESIYENEAYTGVKCNKTYSGRFFRRDKVMGFVALDRDACELALKKTFTPKLLPMEEWDRIDQPHMYDFLPRDVRDLAIAAQAAMWEYRLDPTRPRKKVNAHPASDYLFSHRLVAKQDGEALIGTLSGDDIEYYRHPKGRKGRRNGSIFNRLIAAKPLHEAAVRVLADVLLDQPALRERLTAYVLEQRARAAQDAPGVAELEAERDELKQAIRLTMQTLKGAALADAQEELERMGARRNEIEERLVQVRNVQQADSRSVEEVVEDALAVLKNDSRQLLKLAGEPLREALDRLVPSLSVDMETKAVDLTIALPVWATAAMPKPRKRSKKGKDEVCPATTSWSPAGGWTHTDFTTFRCEYEWFRGSHDKPPCYYCKRSDARLERSAA